MVAGDVLGVGGGKGNFMCWWLGVFLSCPLFERVLR